MNETTAALEHHCTRVGELKMHHVTMGEGPPVVLLHGFPQHWRMWRKVMPLLGAHHTVLALDQRGMGGTTITPGGYDKRTLAADLHGWLDALGLERVHLVGFDVGAGTAYAYAAEHPGRVQSLSILEYAPPGYGFEQGFQPTRDWQSWQLSLFTVPDVAVQFIAGKERELLAWYFWHWSHNPEAVGPEDFEAYVRELQKPGALRAGFSYFASVFDDAEHVRELARRRLPMPVLALGGEQGAGPYVLGAMAQLAEHAEGGVVSRAGHWLADEQPDELARRLLDFFARS